jgi:ribonucleoside-diphosphate reductase alpha chain
MMSAVQPFISGAISKTVNMPEDVTIEDVEQLHIDAWHLGLKAVAIYRDNCKVAQPLSMAKKEEKQEDAVREATSAPTSTPVVAQPTVISTGAIARELPRQRRARTYEFHVADLTGFMTVGEFEDGQPGELFVRVAKQGSTLAGIMDSFAVSVSHGLRHGVPLKVYVRAFVNMNFAPAGMTDDPDVRTATSLIDYMFRRLALDYLSFDDRIELGLVAHDQIASQQQSLLDQPTAPTAVVAPAAQVLAAPQANYHGEQAAPMCFNCGNVTQRAGSCYICPSCGSTSGCS